MAKYNQAMEDLLRYNAAILPQKRSTFNKSTNHITTMDSGYVVPLMWDRVLPGDEKKIRYSGLARMATPKWPVMDEAKFDVACFYVPDRIVWEHARQFYGENLDASFNPDGEYVMPFLRPSRYGVDPGLSSEEGGIGSLNDYFGFPVISHTLPTTSADDNDNYRATALLHRGYHLIWNYFYRNSSVQSAERLSTGDEVTDEEWEVIREIKKACKFPDYFTSLLREPQAGDDVLLPLGEWAPVVTRSVEISDGGVPYNFPPMTGVVPSFAEASLSGNWYGMVGEWNDANSRMKLAFSPEVTDNIESGQTSGFSPVNLWADLTNATSATINNLRAAITVQQLLELDALGGKRYQSILNAHFGVFTPDATLSQPELLGLTRTSVGMRQVLQTSASEDGSPQGNTAAVSVTNIANEWICNKAFTEPGTIFVLGVIRPVHSYSQGLDPLLTKLNRYDHYWPVFDNLGNQPVMTSEIYFTSSHGYEDIDLGRTDQVFGYKEAWTEYRIRPNRVSGLMRPDVPDTLATWNYTSNFSGVPVLNSAFVEEDPELIDRTIVMQNQPQFIVDSYFEYMDTKNMSVHSIPGLTRL